MENSNKCFAEIRIGGMTCASCEILLEKKLKALNGVLKVEVNHKTGVAHIVADKSNLPNGGLIQETIKKAGYRVEDGDYSVTVAAPEKRKWLEIGVALLIIFAGYKLLQGFGLFEYITAGTSAATLGGVLLIGLVAGTSSCLAVTGGLLLSMAAKHNEVNQAETPWQKFKPLLSFNLGRLSSYFVLGGVVGLIGSSLTLSTRMTGYLNIIVALVMLYLALSILKIIPKGSFPIRLPKRFTRWIANLSESEHPLAPFMLGAFTFFLPCGFTQSLQVAALASGSFVSGALTMGVFALGTLPALIGISLISSFAQGTFSRLFLRFSGTLVLVLALFNLNSGLVLTGVDATSFFKRGTDTVDSSESVVQTPDGKQILTMNVDSYGYSPDSFTIQAGKPTVIRAVASNNMGGCASILTAPAYGLTAYLNPGETTELGTIENPTKDFLLTCSMGMFRARVKVVPALN
ncbi:sulfite exporter TauE/SafE family protein [Candidatus Gracilibacteria bacterium]|nr:sulfite exporter TauE/SafE family protein [Candidatus Gracilibacteria bacterium]